MKFAVAAGILAQTLPVLSENEALDLSIQLGQEQTKIADLDRRAVANGGRSRRARAFQGTNGGKAGLLMNQADLNEGTANKKQSCNPFSNDPDVGILSCAKGMYCKEDEALFLGGECASQGRLSRLGHNKFKSLRKPIVKNPETNVECDPSAVIAADVGILLMSCEEGQECLPSDSSSMGGVCVPADYSSRILAVEDSCIYYSPGSCDPSYCDAYYCERNCTGFDPATGTGVITTLLSEYCLGLYRFPGCGDRCVTVSGEVTYTNSIGSKFYICYDFSTPYAHKRCFEQNYETYTCTYLIDGVQCDSCEVVSDINYDGNYTCTSQKFDCGNTGGGAGNTFEINGFAYAPIIESCYQPGPHPICTLCPDEGTTFNNDTFYDKVEVPGLPANLGGGGFYCGALYLLSYAYKTVLEDYCPAISAVTADSCCSLNATGTADPTPAPTTPGAGNPPGASTPAPAPGPGGNPPGAGTTPAPSAGSASLLLSAWNGMLGAAAVGAVATFFAIHY